jgi:hypothetical protein
MFLKLSIMKTFPGILITLVILMFSFQASAQETVKRNLEKFDRIYVQGNIRVELYKSDSPALEANLKNLPEDNLITEIKEGQLNIRLKTGSNKDAEVRIRLYYNDLNDLTVSSKGLITSGEVIKGDKMSFTGKSGGKIELEINLDELVAEVYQGALFELKGSVNKQEVTANTGATYSAYSLEAKESRVKALAGAKAKVKASKLIEASASTGGYIGFIGDPENDLSKTSLGGTIRKYKDEEAAGME